MSWRLAVSLETLRMQIDKAFPDRSKISDGTIGDADHQNRNSDHNPWYGPGIVTALDITHDPRNGVDIDQLTDELQDSRDARIKYVIANGLIMSGNDGPYPWVWRDYDGSNQHTSHFHLSVVASPAADNKTWWNLPSLSSRKADNMSKAVILSGIREYFNTRWHEPRIGGDQPDISLRDAILDAAAQVYWNFGRKIPNKLGTDEFPAQDYWVDTNHDTNELRKEVTTLKKNQTEMKKKLDQIITKLEELS